MATFVKIFPDFYQILHLLHHLIMVLDPFEGDEPFL